MSDPLEGTIYAAGRNAIKHGLKMNGETGGSAIGKILLFFPKLIWKLIVLIFKLYGSMLYLLFGSVVALVALLLKGLDKISFIHFFSFFRTFDSGESEYVEMSKGKKAALIILKIFGSIIYFVVGLITFILRGIMKVINIISWFKFYNNFLSI